MSIEVEIDLELYQRFQALCRERDLDSEEELARCLQEYIASVREETEV